MVQLVLSTEAIAGLKAHQYKSGSYTPFDCLVYKYFWNPILEHFPLWMAPNLITFIGFVAAFVNIVPALLMNPMLSAGVAPWWVFLMSSGCFFFYTTMDAIDGGQARRTKSSSPLGQLFDHGCDGVLSGIAPILQVHALGLGLTRELPLLIAVTQGLFFLGMWEEKYTGICRTTILGLIGTTEFMMFFVAHQFSAAFLVPKSLHFWIFLITFSGAFFSASTSVISVLRNAKKSTSALTEIGAIFALNFAFYYANFEKSTFAPYLVQALTNSFLIIRMIVASMSKTPFDSIQLIVVPPIMCIAFTPSWINMYLIGLFLFMGFYLVNICSQIACALGISVFRIPLIKISSSKSS